MNCGAVEAQHLASGHCSKQPGGLGHMPWTKFDPAFIPKAPAGWTRSTWMTYVRYVDQSDTRAVVAIPIKEFLKSRDPRGVLRLAISAERARLAGVQKIDSPHGRVFKHTCR
jgi:hypothetical protein